MTLGLVAVVIIGFILADTIRMDRKIARAARMLEEIRQANERRERVGAHRILVGGRILYETTEHDSGTLLRTP